MLTSTLEMAKKQPPAERQVHPTGERFTVDDRFRVRVRDKLESDGMSQRDLAALIKVQPASITNLLNSAGRYQSRIVMRIIKLWKWQYIVDGDNVIVIVDKIDAQRRIARALPTLSEADQEMLAQLAESLASKR